MKKLLKLQYLLIRLELGVKHENFIQLIPRLLKSVTFSASLKFTNNFCLIIYQTTEKSVYNEP